MLEDEDDPFLRPAPVPIFTSTPSKPPRTWAGRSPRAEASQGEEGEEDLGEKSHHGPEMLGGEQVHVGASACALWEMEGAGHDTAKDPGRDVCPGVEFVGAGGEGDLDEAVGVGKGQELALEGGVAVDGLPLERVVGGRTLGDLFNKTIVI